MHTGQLFFDDALNNEVVQVAPYSSKGEPDMKNSNDSIYQDAGAASAISDMTESADGYAGTITVGVRTS